MLNHNNKRLLPCLKAKGSSFQKVLSFFGHSFAAGISVEIPPLAIIELYNASKCWIEAAKEFNAGCRENEKIITNDQEITNHSLEIK